MLLCIFLVLPNYGIISIKILWKEVHVEHVVELQISYKFNHSFLNQFSLKYLARYISRCIILCFLISLLLRKKDNFTMRNRYKKRNEVFPRGKTSTIKNIIDYIHYILYIIYIYIYIYILILYFFIKNYVTYMSLRKDDLYFMVKDIVCK